MAIRESSPQVVQQRIRSRICEWLEMLVAYQSEPPPWDLNETLNQWDDWNFCPAGVEAYPRPIFTLEEAASLVAVARAVASFCEATPDTISDERKAMSEPAWANLVASAGQALDVLSRRNQSRERPQK